jgi:hypothetical protein
MKSPQQNSSVRLIKILLRNQTWHENKCVVSKGCLWLCSRHLIAYLHLSSKMFCHFVWQCCDLTCNFFLYSLKWRLNTWPLKYPNTYCKMFGGSGPMILLILDNFLREASQLIFLDLHYMSKSVHFGGIFRKISIYCFKSTGRCKNGDNSTFEVLSHLWDEFNFLISHCYKWFILKMAEINCLFYFVQIQAL